MLLVVAYGNPIRGDDAVGWRVAKALLGTPEAEIVFVHQLAPELAERVSRAAGVLFVDAGRVERPGTVVARPLDADSAGSEVGHALGPGTLLALSYTLYGRRPRATLLTVAGGEFGFAEVLSPAVSDALGEAVARARAILNEWASAEAGPAIAAVR